MSDEHVASRPKYNIPEVSRGSEVCVGGWSRGRLVSMLLISGRPADTIVTIVPRTNIPERSVASIRVDTVSCRGSDSSTKDRRRFSSANQPRRSGTLATAGRRRTAEPSAGPRRGDRQRHRPPSRRDSPRWRRPSVAPRSRRCSPRREAGRTRVSRRCGCGGPKRPLRISSESPSTSSSTRWNVRRDCTRDRIAPGKLAPRRPSATISISTNSVGTCDGAQPC